MKMEKNGVAKNPNLCRGLGVRAAPEIRSAVLS